MAGDDHHGMTTQLYKGGSGRAEPGWFPIPEVESVRIDGAPGWLQNVHPLFVSDVHLRRWVDDTRLDAFVSLLGSLGADMLLLGGDYAEGDCECRRFFRGLSALRFPLGAYAVPGNNDRMARGELRELMEGAGVTLLVNETSCIPLNGGTLYIAGCDEHKHGKPCTAGLFPDLGAESVNTSVRFDPTDIAGDRGEHDIYRILLSHYPAPPDCSCELMLTGHTHGGQVRLFGLSPYALGFERRYHLMAESGLLRVGDMHLLVSPGVGVSKFPLRYNAPAQIHLLEFVT